MSETPFAFEVRAARPGEVRAVAGFRAGPGVVRMGVVDVLAEFQAGRMRPEWSFVAVRPDGALLGRAVWWGVGGSPLVLAEWDVAGDVPNKAEVGAALLLSGIDIEAFREEGDAPLYTIRVPFGWSDEECSVSEVGWRCAAGEIVGWNEFTERLTFEWVREFEERGEGGEGEVEAPRGPRCSFREGTDEEFRTLVAACAEGSLDATTARGLASGAPESFDEFLADLRSEIDGDRHWWRIAEIAGPRTVGYVLPARHDGGYRVAHLGVLPEFRGHGFVDDLVAHARTVLRAEGAATIAATTDSLNYPYTSALLRAGFSAREVEIHLEAP